VLLQFAPYDDDGVRRHLRSLGVFFGDHRTENDGEPSPCSLEWTTMPGDIRGYISFQLVADETRLLVPRTTDRHLEPGSSRSLEALLRFEKYVGTAR
jgi:hypothetical protein